MPLVPRTLLLALLTLGASAAHAQADLLVGTWEMVVPSDLLPGSDAAALAAALPQITFGADGTLTMRFARPHRTQDVVPAGTYTVEGDTITGVIGGEPQPARFWFDRGYLFIDDSSDVIQFRRAYTR